MPIADWYCLSDRRDCLNYTMAYFLLGLSACADEERQDFFENCCGLSELC